jgi:xanthine dehydrogenase accessory factor
MAGAADGLTVSAATNERIVRALSAAVEGGEAVVLATIVETRRSVPRHAGTKMLVYRDGRTIGTVGGGEMESKAVAAAHETLRTGKPRLVEYELIDPDRGDPGICGGELKLYLEPYMPAYTVFVIGCGHVGRTVIDLAHWLGYRTVAVDDRAELVTAEALPNADERFSGTVEEALQTHEITAETAVIVVTRSPEIDATIVPLLLRTPAPYIGVMGSKKRWQSTRQQIIAGGTSPADIDRVHVPIGLDIHAETLEEIAVSIMSEVIKVNRGGES